MFYKKFLRILQIIIRKKFWITTSWILMWSFFFDENSVKKIIAAKIFLKNLHREQILYVQKIKDLEEDIKTLNGDDECFEKFVREKYFMRKKGEDVFVVKS